MPTFVARAIAYLFVGVMCATGPIILAGVLTSAVHRAIFVRNAVHTDGKIINVRCPNQSTRHGYQCLPIFRFTGGDGKMYMVESATGGKLSDFAIGAPVQVVYTGDHPETARIDSFAQLWTPLLVIGLVGGVLTIVPVQIVRARSRQRRMAAGLTPSCET